MTPNLTNIAKSLCKNSTDAERVLWRHLRTKQIERLKFRRQEPIGRYIVDFVCFEAKVIVEVDGGQHSHEQDKVRDAWLSSQGFNILRFWNHDVLQKTEAIVEVIWHACMNGSPSPIPSHQGRGD